MTNIRTEKVRLQPTTLSLENLRVHSAPNHQPCQAVCVGDKTHVNVLEYTTDWEKRTPFVGNFVLFLTGPCERRGKGSTPVGVDIQYLAVRNLLLQVLPVAGLVEVAVQLTEQPALTDIGEQEYRKF